MSIVIYMNRLQIQILYWLNKSTNNGYCPVLKRQNEDTLPPGVLWCLHLFHTIFFMLMVTLFLTS
jgi:hypothetical protein